MSSSGARLALTTTVAGVNVVAMGYKYNTKTVLFFLFARGAGSCADGQPYEARYPDKKTGQSRTRWVPRPCVLSRFFDNSPVIDNHNQARQFHLELEHSWVTQSGWFRIETTLQGINVADAWNAVKNDQQHREYNYRSQLTIQEFANDLAGELLGPHARRDAAAVGRPAVAAAAARAAVTAAVDEHTLEPMPVTAGKRKQKYCVSCKANGRVVHGSVAWAEHDDEEAPVMARKTSLWCRQCHIPICCMDGDLECWAWHVDQPVV